MRNFNNDDEDEGQFGDDFFGRWEEFNRMMNEMNDRQFRRGLNKMNLEELMKLIAESRNRGENPLGIRIIPLGEFKRNDLNIPEDEMNSESGEDESGKWETKNWTSPDGSMSFSSFTRSSSNEDDVDLPDEVARLWASKLRDRRNQVNPEESKKIRLEKLKKTLDYLVENEKYEKASEVKKMIDELSSEPKEPGEKES